MKPDAEIRILKRLLKDLREHVRNTEDKHQELKTVVQRQADTITAQTLELNNQKNKIATIEGKLPK